MPNVSVLNTTSQVSGKTLCVAENTQTISGAWTFTGNQTFNGNVTIGNAASDTLTVTSTITSNLLFTDATYDIGASAATRPRDLFLSRNATIGGTLAVTGVATFTAVPVFSGTAATTFNGDVVIAGTTPLLTIGDAGEEDAGILLDGNVQDYYIALDDSADELVIGLGSVIGTTPIVQFTTNGSATFTSSGGNTPWAFNDTVGGGSIVFQTSGTPRGTVGVNASIVSATDMVVMAVGTLYLAAGNGNTYMLDIDSTGTYPHNNNNMSIGKAGNRWTEVFAVNGTINTSDENFKDIVGDVPGLDFINALKPFAGRWKDKPELLHYWLGARHTGALVPLDSAMVLRDDEHGWGMNIGELSAPIVKALQEISARLDILEAQK